MKSTASPFFMLIHFSFQNDPREVFLFEAIFRREDRRILSKGRLKGSEFRKDVKKCNENAY